MPQTHHLLIAYAATNADGCTHALQTLRLPHLERLLAQLGRSAPEPGQDSDPTLPHERALAQALGLPSPATPWAAWESRTLGQPCAWITPCHWQAGADQVLMHPPEQLGLDAAQERALLAIVAPWLAQDGITLTYHAPLRWLACGSTLADLHTASLERVQGRDTSHWKPQGTQARWLQRLHTELQMLLYNHPFNDERSARGLLPVNAFWLHGAGQLDALPPPRSPAPQLDVSLRASALAGDWAAWAQAWQALDAGPVATLAAQAQAGHSVYLSLCGENGALHWHSGARPWAQRIQSLFRTQRLLDVREQL